MAAAEKWVSEERSFNDSISEAIKKKIYPALESLISSKGMSPGIKSSSFSLSPFKITFGTRILTISFRPSIVENNKKISYLLRLTVEYYDTTKFDDVVASVDEGYNQRDIENMSREALNKIERVMKENRLIK